MVEPTAGPVHCVGRGSCSRACRRVKARQSGRCERGVRLSSDDNPRTDGDGDERDWELGIFGDLGERQADLLGGLLEVEPGSRGTLWFDSAGGSVYVGLALASLIRLRELDVGAVVIGECSSSALIPFAACRRRFVTPQATLLFHPVRWQSDEEVRVEEAAEWARHFRLLEEDLDALLARLFDCPVERLNEWTRPGRFVTGEELAAAGLAELVDLFATEPFARLAPPPAALE